MYPPDGLLTYEGTRHDVKYDPRIIATDPSISNDIDHFPPVDLCLVTTTVELNMSTSEDDPSSGLNGRLRPRKSHVPSPQGKTKIKPEGKTSLDKSKKTNSLSKPSPNKQDDLASKSDCSPPPQFLCPYCDRKFATRQTVSKHMRRIHYPTPNQDTPLNCLFCNHTEVDSNLIRHMIDSHPNQYFACLDCHTRFPSTTELAEHKLNVCEKQKITYRTKPRPKTTRGSKKSKKPINVSTKASFSKQGKDFQEGHGFNGIVISCELKPPQDPDGADIEDNITTNLIMPSNKKLANSGVLEKNAVIVLDDVQWHKRIPPNFSFHNTDPDQILSRLGVVHRSPRAAESTKKDWFKALDDATQKFERCFDTKFYSKVASNVQENLTKFLDGSFNFNPDPDSTIKTRKSINNVVINTAEGFPILLASEQYSRSMFDSYMPRAIAPKHKWKWDNLENDRSLMTAAEILKRDSHTNNCIITLVSSLDIWTQLSMRQKFEDKFHIQPIEKKTEKQNIISKELKEILESRDIPTTSQIVKRCASNKPLPRSSDLEFPASLGLVPTAPTYEVRPAVLSGEWVRPRCLVCCACGEQTTDSKGLSLHMSTRHSNASVQCYEIVGEQLLNADILKHLYVPPSQVSNRTRLPRGFRECTKCNKSVTLDDLHQHMLDCAGDTPAVRRRQPRQRPFGVRRRRPRLPDNTIRKKIRKDIRSRQRRQKTHGGPRPRIRTEVGDAETIRKMIADLPAKRHRVLVNPLNMMQRPRRKLDMQRSKVILKKCSTEGAKTRKRTISKDVSREKGDQNKNSSNVDDDEDNKPLKPKIKLSSTTTFRRREPLKRQAVVSLAKRKSVRNSKRMIENTDKVEASNRTKIQQSSLEKPPQRLDLEKASYNTRDHAANRGTSSDRDRQRPSCSGTNGTANNHCAPAQNVPLKHSIARLTANSETHDKSVQFHHSFLVQQECNNTNEHVPTGNRTMFENEAVVSKLDKPPLYSCQKSFLDIQSLHKNKTNKPRKGLNDCIAMLKNKLVDLEPCQAPGYASVQCGSDEPIDDEPRVVDEKNDKDSSVMKDESIQEDPHFREVTTEKCEKIQPTLCGESDNLLFPTKPDEVKKSSENLQIEEEINLIHYKKKQNPEIIKSPQNEQDNIKKNQPSSGSLLQDKDDIVPHYDEKSFQKVEHFSKDLQCREEITQNIKTSLDITHIQEEVNLKTQIGQESDQSSECVHGEGQVRRDSTSKVKHISEALQYQEKNDVKQPQDSMRKSKKQSDILSHQENSSETSPFRHEITQKHILNPENSILESLNLVSHKKQAVRKLKRNLHLPENLDLSPQYQQVTAHQSTDTINQEKLCMRSQYRQDSNLISKHNEELDFDISHRKTDFMPTCEITKVHSKEVSSRNRLHNDSDKNGGTEKIKELDKRRSTDMHETSKIDRLDIKTTWQKPLDVFPANSRTSQQSNFYAEGAISHNSSEILANELAPPQSIDVFEDSRIRDISASIPAAHASTMVESIMSAPLDLSSKVPNVTRLFNSESYDNYGTLDLSNKNTITRTTLEPEEEDVIVDLRVKPSYPRNSPITLDLCVKPCTSKSSNIREAVPDIILHSFPTDLSVRGNDALNKLRSTSESVEIHDLSTTLKKPSQTTHFSKPSDNILFQNKIPETSEITKQNFAQDIAADDETTDSVDYVAKRVSFPDDLSQQVVIKEQKISPTTTIVDQPYISEQKEVSESDDPKTQHVDSQSPPLGKLATSQLQKHIYDPTLKIPQYKIRATISEAETAKSHKDPHLITSANVAVVNSSLSRDLIPAINSSCSEIYRTAITSSLISPISSVVTMLPKLGKYPQTSFSRIESTTPVYTLANACIAVTKIESSTTGLTNTLLSIPGSTIASTVPVYTLTGTTVGTPTAFTTKNQNLLHSTASHPNDHIVGLESHESARITDKEMDCEGITKDVPVDQDPETAKKIAMLPKELVEIIGSMPVNARNQLLNVLPHYVSTTVANCARTAENHQNAKDTFSAIPNQVDDNIKASESENTPMTASTASHACTRLMKPETDLVRESDSSGEINILGDQCALHEKAQPIKEIVIEYSDSVNNDMKSAAVRSTSKHIGKVDSDITDLSKININDDEWNIDGDNNKNRFIDLTEDDILPPVTAAANISRSISTPPKDLSVIEQMNEVPNKQKGNSDKTASLRAVRIRAPSLRQKEKQKLNLLSKDQVLTQNEQDAVMQLAEMSMSHSQFDNKVVIDSKETANILKVRSDGESAKETLKLSIDDVVNDTNEKVYTPKSMSNSAKLTGLPLDRDLSNTDQINIGNETSKNRSLIAVDPATENTCCNSEKKVLQVESYENNNVSNEPPTNENKQMITLEEEDSEDDIILAAIVKQKRQNKVTKSKRNIKKKNKKMSKTNPLPVSNLNKLDGTTPITREINHLNKFTANEESCNSLDVSYESSRSEHNKFQGRAKKKNSQDINIVLDKQTFLSDLKPCIEASKLQLIDNKIESSGPAHNIVECGKENKDNLININKKPQIEIMIPNKAKSQEGLLTNIEMNLNQNENVLLKDKPKKKKRFSEVNSSIIHEREKAKSQSKISTPTLKSDVGQDINSTSESKISQSRDVTSSAVGALCSNMQEADKNKQNSLEFRSEVKSILSSCTSNIGDAMNESQEIENNFDTPLRRSRRGKSLYLDRNLQHENLNTDPPVDQKAPLTKKQLIFSKLLFDEVQHTKSLISNSEKDSIAVDKVDTADATTSESSGQTNKIETANTTTSDIGQTNKTVVSEASTESCKSLKRRKSPPAKRKSKKRKSIKDNNFTEVKFTVESDLNLKDNCATTDSVLSVKTDEQLLDNFNTVVISKDPAIVNKISYPENDNTIQIRNSLEKRKVSITPPGVELDYSSKPKKTKFNKLSVSDVCKMEDTELVPEIENMPCAKSETPTTCYDVPVAARRTRSKSVAIKSSGAESYDPYDIDLDDMIQNPEPLRKTGAKNKEIKVKEKRSSSKIESQVSESIEQKTEQEDFNVDTNVEKTKSGPSSLLSKRKCDSNAFDLKKDVKSKTSTILSSEQEWNESSNAITESFDVISKDNISDSDESSKSDEPLNKYVESRVKKMSATRKVSRFEGSESSVNINENKTEARNVYKKKLETPSKNSDAAELSNEIEEQMRSEQFMESFGFFSERKPRKSNLLATKKISETFHIIANEGEDLYYSGKERSSRKNLQADTKKSTEGSYVQSHIKKSLKRGRKKKNCTKAYIRYCSVCKKEFQRPDNYVRHQMTLLHVSKLSEVELKLKTVPIPEEPNYLIVYKQHIDRLKILTDKAAKQKKNSKTKIVLPRLDEILADVHKTIREQQIVRRSLSRDETLFIDCCDLLTKPRMSVTPVLALTSSGAQSSSVPQTPRVAAAPVVAQISSVAKTSVDERVLSEQQTPCGPLSSSVAQTTIDERTLSGQQSSSGAQSPTGAQTSSIELSSDVQTSSIEQTLDSAQTAGPVQASSGAARKIGGANTPKEAQTLVDINTQYASELFVSELNNQDESDDISEFRNDDDVDSITAKSIMESEEVRNLENDLISGLKKVASEKKAKRDEHNATSSTTTMHPHEISTALFSRPDCEQIKVRPENRSASVESDVNKGKKNPEYKEKMYPDVIEDIDMFEDKFDKIKRKCRSQAAAAAKHVQNVTEPSPGNKGRKKTDRKKGKKTSKKNYQNTVMTKGALKGFDGIKVSIPTSDINISAIVVPHDGSPKKKRKSSSKKKREKKDSETSSRNDSDHRLKDGSYSQKKVDVYEFMDNEDAELFEFRPSTLMERFKSINKETPSTSKRNESAEDVDNSSESASDGDDFVYMSDDYVCSDDETENSSISCELGNPKNEAKKLTHLKRKDVVEKNAVMGKIFKHNAVRTEKRNVKSKESIKPKANLDQLFDSLLEEKLNTTLPSNGSESPKLDQFGKLGQQETSPKRESVKDESNKPRGPKPSMSPVKLNIPKTNLSFKNLGELEHDLSASIYEVPERYKYGPSTSKQMPDLYAPSTSAAYTPPVCDDEIVTGKRDSSPSKKHNVSSKNRKSPLQEISKPEQIQIDFSSDKLLEFEHSAEFDEDTGVARHRARRKCTVGKQNVLAESWSSESEPDGLPPRPASADSVVANAGRKKKGRKKDSQQAFARRGKVAFNKKQDVESRVNSNKKNTSSGDTSQSIAGSEGSGVTSSATSSAEASAREACPPPAPPGPSTSSGVGASGSEASTSKARPRPKTFYWTSEGDDEHEHQQQQHGWIVGNSHKRLVTMLAHAKGRKRNNDDKRQVDE